jgi:hypothetical protein
MQRSLPKLTSKFTPKWIPPNFMKISSDYAPSIAKLKFDPNAQFLLMKV